MNNITTPFERQSTSNQGLRDRLFKTLDAVIAGKVGKDEVEAVCFISGEILKSAKVDLEFAESARKNDELSHKIKVESLDLLGSVIEESINDERAIAI